MMQLVCNGIALDLYANTQLKFKKKNTLFAFDDLCSERTTEFKLPCTPKNDRAFAIARIPAYKGDAMRKQYTAQLQNGLTITDGFLYINEFDGKDYSVVFVGGFVYNLKAWDNSKWGEVLLPDLEMTYYPNTNIYDANANNIPIIARVRYHNDNEDTEIQQLRNFYMHSIHLEQLFTLLTQQGLFKITGLVGQNIRLIRNDEYKYKDVLEKLQNVQSYANYLDVETNTQAIRVENVSVQGVDVPMFICNTGMKITFPSDTPTNLCLVYSKNGEVMFMGSRRFTFDNIGDPIYSGQPLAGQTVEIGEFDGNLYEGGVLLMDASGAHPLWQPNLEIYFNIGSGGMANVPTYNLNVRVTCESDDVHIFYPYGLKPHSLLTDLSLADLLKAYAACTNTLICMRKDGSVEFVQSYGENQIELKDIVKKKNVSRTFSNFAQLNIIKFKEDSAVEDWERIRAEYIIENVNIDKEKTVLELAYIEGGQYPEQIPPFTYENPLQPIPDNTLIYVRDTKQGFRGFYIPNDTIALSDTETFLQRVTIPKLNILQHLCDESTKYKVNVRMTYSKFSEIDGDVTLLLDGTRYTWIEANWGSEQCEFVLQKIA